MSSLIFHLWADLGTKFVASKPVQGELRQRAFADVTEAGQHAAAENARGSNVYHSAAVFGGSRRLQTEALGARAFWLDQDVKTDKPDTYTSQQEAYDDLVRFCGEVRLPLPLVVNSGNGLQSYWLIDQLVPAQMWQKCAERLKAVLTAKGVKQDPTRTADIASVMRWPGSWNFGSTAESSAQPKASAEGVMVPALALEYFKHALEAVPVAATPPTRKQSKFTSSLDVKLEFPPSHVVDIANKCAQIARVRDARGQVAEPEWYNFLGICSFSADGSTVAHEWSKGDARYDAQQVQTKLAQWEKLGPPTCSKFHGTNPASCGGCPFHGKITSPIELGVRLTPVVVQSDPSVSEPKRAVPEQVPGGWKIGVEGVYHDKGVGMPDKVLGLPMYFESVNRFGYSDAFATVRWQTPQKSWCQDQMSLQVIGEARSTRQWLLQHAVADFNNIEAVMKFFRDQVTDLSRQKDPDHIHERLGWTPDGAFVLGANVVRTDQISAARVSPKLSKEMVAGLEPKGDLAAWVSVTKTFENRNYWPHALTLLAGLAAPILKLVEVEGAVLSLAGSSGAGKTSAMKFALSAFGDPKSFIQAPHSTMVARNAFLWNANNLPVGIDDIGNHSQHLSDLIYMAANGRTRARGERSGGLKDQESWCTILMLTTNNPVMDFNDKIVGEAAKRRVLELPLNHKPDRRDMTLLSTTADAVHGVAGPVFIRGLVANRQWVTTTYKAVAESFATLPGIPDANRFGLWLVAGAWVAGMAARSWGLIQFDPEPVVQYALAHLASNAAATTAPVDRVDEAVRAFLNENHAKFSVRDDATGSRWERVPDNREVAGRIARDSNMMHIAVHRLRNFVLVQWGVDSVAFRQWLSAHVVRGTRNVLLAPNGSQERCYSLDLNRYQIEPAGGTSDS